MAMDDIGTPNTRNRRLWKHELHQLFEEPRSARSLEYLTLADNAEEVPGRAGRPHTADCSKSIRNAIQRLRTGNVQLGATFSSM
jgi:hypothetical protein